MIPTFHGEVQFARYSDGSRSGPCVTFRLDDRSALDTFAGLEGKRYMLAIVEIGDDEQPVQPKAAKPKAQRERMAPLCEWAVLRCAEPQFQEWIRPVYDRLMGWNGAGYGDVTPSDDFGGNAAEYAAHCIKVICMIDSRKELDTRPAAAELFHERVRKPYTKWLADRNAP